MPLATVVLYGFLVTLRLTMTFFERRERANDAMVVENAIWLAVQSSQGAALYYMHRKGIAQHVSARVLMGPQYRRSYFRRLKNPAD